ncbi:hypothetical protein EAP46_25665 [Salmonella enterica]|nr:hypothetical protein [Salmonella enterica]EAQ9961925.1 hypothetical protein [Salmonella enterica]EAS6315617.1 hypothetical protein [Salmonella enterica]
MSKNMIQHLAVGIITGLLFFIVWSILKMIFFGKSVNMIFALPTILVFAACAVGVYYIRVRTKMRTAHTVPADRE